MTCAGPALRAIRRIAGLAVIGGLVLAVLLAAWGWWRGRPADLPWTPLDLGRPAGAFTGRKLAALTGDPAACRAVLEQAGIRYTALPPRTGAGIRYTALPPRTGAGRCGYRDGVRLVAGGARRVMLLPVGPPLACPVAAGLAAWEWTVVQPAADRLLGSRVIAIDHLGSYSCRRLYGRSTGALSEHATADAIDVAGFRLADGRRITVAGDWHGRGRAGRFLHAVRDGACGLFATTLSPDYNAAHRDHLHLDQAERGALGWRACR